ncbi:hypothetical protein Scep_010218 [Stephania cephalantha]|uniref:RING-type E3 ubiquitin transferase n=1 Tax=Stephania cephalantha TaxID=152367 RepID=A0AAP0JX31_9MAGN
MMDNQSLRCLANSISNFIHLVSSQNVRSMPIQKDYKNMVGSLKLLKPVLDEIIDSKILLDKILGKEIEELDVAVNDARDFMEKWNPKMSKIWSVLQSGPLAMKVQCCTLETCHALCRLPKSSSITSLPVSIQEMQFLEHERISVTLEVILRDQKDNLIPRASHLSRVVDVLNLTSNQELLMESVALEKERAKAVMMQRKDELDLIDQSIHLIAHIRDCMTKHKQFETVNDLLVPPYFRCPLSLGLMLDPVIVASGQTYERAFIQKWLDHGLTVCPKTRQTLAHTNLIPNYTVKALIANWCEENNMRFFDSNNGDEIMNILSQNISSKDLFLADCFRGSSRDSNFTPTSSLTSRSSSRHATSSQKERFQVSSKYSEEYSDQGQAKVNLKFDQPSPGQSYTHSRSESTSSAISSIDFLPIACTVGPAEVSCLSRKCGEVNELSEEVLSECHISSSSKETGFFPFLLGKQLCGSTAQVSIVENGGRNHQRNSSLQFSDSGLDDLTAASHVEDLIDDLRNQSLEVQTSAAAELRLLAKHNMENRIIIAQCGAIAPLISLLYSEVKLTQEHAVTALLNLSINEKNKVKIAEAGAVEPLIHILNGGNAGAKENAAATLFSLSVLEEYKMKIGRSGAIKALVDLLGSGTLRGKKDAATALFNLSIFHENKARIVQAGAVKHLIELMDPDTVMIDKAVALLANLSTIQEGRSAITREGGIPLLVEVVETGSQRGKENAASILLQLCINNQKFCSLVLQEGAVPPLVALSQSGTPRAKEKAQQLLSHFRNQREGAAGKVRS